MSILSGVGGRALGIITSPRSTYEAIAQDPRWAGVLTLTFVLAAGATATVLVTDVGQLALLDQWERTASAFGRQVNDTEYAALAAASQNGAAYAALVAFAAGPLLAFALSGVLFLAFQATARGTVTFGQVLAIVAHASVILALRQLIAAPIVYVSETLASPITLGTLVRMMDATSPLARFFAIIDLFVVWWVMVLAVGMSVLYRRPARRLAGVFVGAYVTLAVVLTAVMAATGGTA
jgi:hypothetical protein